MAEMYNIYEAKTHFSKLLEQSAQGKKVVIAKAGKPQWEIVPLARKKPKRMAGRLKGKVWVAPDAFSPEVDERIAADFQASELFPSKGKTR